MYNFLQIKKGKLEAKNIRNITIAENLLVKHGSNNVYTNFKTFVCQNYKSHLIVNKLKYFIISNYFFNLKKLYYLFIGENFCFSLFILSILLANF